jgi:hypothetical protein
MIPIASATTVLFIGRNCLFHPRNDQYHFDMAHLPADAAALKCANVIAAKAKRDIIGAPLR